MTKIKVGDIVRIITPIAITASAKKKNPVNKESTSLADGVVGRKAKVLYISKSKKDPLVKVKVEGKKNLYVSRYSGWEFKKCNYINKQLTCLDLKE